MKTAILLLLAPWLMLGCASTAPPRTVRLDQLESVTDLAKGQPLVIEVHAGDTLPVDVSLQGPLFESAKDAPPIVLTAKRNFFLRIDSDGVHQSLDGKDFSKKSASPGSFQIGIGTTRERGTRATVTIKGATPNEPN